MRALFIVRLLVGAFVASTHAQDWINPNPAGSDWSIPANWQGGAVPTADNFAAEITVGKAIVTGTAASYNTWVETGAALQIAGTGVFTGQNICTRGGDVIIDPGASVTLKYNSGYFGDNSYGGTFTSTNAALSGGMIWEPQQGKTVAVNVTGGTFDDNYSLSFVPTGGGTVTATFSGGVKITGIAPLQVDSTQGGGGTATVTFTGAGTSADLSSIEANKGTINVAAGATLSAQSLQFYNQGKINLSGGSKITIAGTNATAYLGDNGSGSMNIGAGSSLSAVNMRIGAFSLTLDAPTLANGAAALTAGLVVWQTTDGPLKLTINGAAPDGYTWDFLTATSFNPGSLKNLSVEMDSPGWSVVVGTNKLTLVYSAVPEPSTLILVGLGGVALFWAARSRRKA